MNCHRAKKLIFEFVDGGLADEKVQLDLEHHLSECSACDKLASQLTRCIDLIHRAPREELDENFNWKVRLAIHKERNAIQERAASQGSLFRAWNFRYAASAVSGFAVILVAGWIAINSGLTPVPVSVPLEADVMPRSEGLASDADANATLEKSKSSDTPVIAAMEDAEEEAPVQSGKSEATPPQANEPAPVLRGGRVPASSPSELVTQGAVAPSPEAARAGGAIDLVENTAELDSLVHQETKGMTEEQRVLYFQKRIQQLNVHLEKCRHAERK